jgi:hypothetical protein
LQCATVYFVSLLIPINGKVFLNQKPETFFNHRHFRKKLSKKLSKKLEPTSDSNEAAGPGKNANGLHGDQMIL